jgi:voltage-gated sodium channel
MRVSAYLRVMFRRALDGLINENVVVAVILLNTTAIILRGFEVWRTHIDLLLFTVDYTCTVFFVLEGITKISRFGFAKYWSSGWNRFDFTVVVISMPMLLTPVLDLHEFTVVLVLRTGRLLRFFRLLRFVPDADRIWTGVGRGLKAVAGVGVALGLYNVTLGLAACYLFSDASPEHFGDPLVATYTLFKVFTVEGWYEVPELVAAGMDPMLGALTKAFFVGAVLTGGVVGLSMANAVFVDEMVIDNTNQIEDQIAALLDEVVALRAENRALSEKLQATVDVLSRHEGG